MRYLTLKINPNTELSIDNSIWGKETVKLNGVVVSEKVSFWGSIHKFKVVEQGEDFNYEVRIKMTLNIGIEYFVAINGETLMDDSLPATKSEEVKRNIKFVAFVLWAILLISMVVKGGNIAIPIALLPFFWLSSSKTGFVRNIDLTTSKSI
jgi:hypothetical protein